MIRVGVLVRVLMQEDRRGRGVGAAGIGFVCLELNGGFALILCRVVVEVKFGRREGDGI